MNAFLNETNSLWFDTQFLPFYITCDSVHLLINFAVVQTVSEQQPGREVSHRHTTHISLSHLCLGLAHTTSLCADTSSSRTNLWLKRQCESLWLHLWLHLRLHLAERQHYLSSHFFSDWLQGFESHGRRRAGASRSRSKVLFDRDTDSSIMDMTRVLWSPNYSNQYILTSMGDKASLWGLLFQGIL